MLTTFAVFAGLFAAGTGTIDVQVVPGNASIEIDGKAVKTSRITVKAGTHKVRATATGYSAQTRTVSVGAGKTARVQLRLVQSKVTKPTVKPPAGGTTVGGTTVGAKRPSRAPIIGISKRPSGKTPVISPRPSVKPGVRPTVRPRPTPKVTPKTKTKPDNGPIVVRRPSQPGAGRRPAPARGDVAVTNGGGARGSRGGGGSNSLRPFAVLSFVVGGLAITGGVITHNLADEKAQDFNHSVDRQEKLGLRDDAKALDTASTVLYGVGATGVALGVLLLALDPGDSRATVAPLPEGGAMVGYGGTF
ncbi:MAG: PEGA domain-containing protein [bacterium]